MAPRSKRDKTDSDAAQNGREDVESYEQELISLLNERIKPNLNRGAIPLLARSLAKEIAKRDLPQDALEDEESAEEWDDDEDAPEVEDEALAEPDDDDEDDDEDGPEADSSLDLEAELHEIQEKLGDDWVLYFAVKGDDAWLTAEKEDASQRIEAPTASVLVKAVQVLNEGGGRSAAKD